MQASRGARFTAGDLRPAGKLGEIMSAARLVLLLAGCSVSWGVHAQKP
jgi:hypothetical protein